MAEGGTSILVPLMMYWECRARECSFIKKQFRLAFSGKGFPDDHSKIRDFYAENKLLAYSVDSVH